ncbi:MAG: hypothetical protein IKG30_00965 [Clostridiales bacterium]|nr:hypothetical protein [Clostridiales bacterium]
MKAAKLFATGVSVLASAILLAGCAGLMQKKSVDMQSLRKVDDKAFINALGTIGIDESDVDIMSDTSFKFTDYDKDFATVINLDATSDKMNRYSFTLCADKATARALFDYYYNKCSYVFDAKEFTGVSSHEVNGNDAYVLIDGTYDNKSDNTYTPYHNAIYLKDDTVIVAIANDYGLTVNKEINDFLKALGYPHP